MIKLYKGDCLEVMKTIEDNSIDAIITDPPYTSPTVHAFGRRFDKLLGADTEAGSRVEIIWNELGDYPDNGYLFELPGICTPDEADIFVHIPKPQNPSGMDTSPPVFLHLYDILTNEQVNSVTVKNI
jgi:hypothetical protein